MEKFSVTSWSPGDRIHIRVKGESGYSIPVKRKEIDSLIDTLILFQVENKL